MHELLLCNLMQRAHREHTVELRKGMGSCIIFHLKKKNSLFRMFLVFNIVCLLQMSMPQVSPMYGQMPTQLPTPPMFVPSQLSVVRFISPIL
jgi:hypothetical protein